MCTVAGWVPSAIHFSALRLHSNFLSQRCPLPYYQMVWTKHFPGSDLRHTSVDVMGHSPSGICWNMLKSCTLYIDCIAWRYNDLSCKKKIHHLSRISCDLGQYFDCFHLDSLHFLQVHLGRKDPKVSWRGFRVSESLRLWLALFAVVFVAFWGFLVRKGNLTSQSISNHCYERNVKVTWTI